ncbi:efflux RND transporter periplasmic adaptor subunit [uncultured Bacteroides sp.]|uniref:efflux RND transporter periplasmic adaptor subunit n=1 Tax=uncultured Bacteroides sp. TaxID=162156 RepID=UPI0025ED6491|nr:efflux RND transporter periplasmic adaptor subunit [uncultured Bacteroides sp.]
MKKTPILFMLLCTILFMGCKDKNSPQQQETVHGSKLWKTTVVKQADTEVSQLFSASIQGRQDIEIRPQVQGKIVSVDVKEGQDVKQGQTLFTIDPVPFRTALAQASAQVRAAQASEASAKLKYESSKRLFDNKVVSKHELQLAYNTMLDAQAQVALASAAEASARNNLSYTVVKSPANGVVGTLPFRQGALVGPETTQPLTSISDNSEMYVYFSMDESQLLGLLRKYGSTAKAIAQMDSVGLMLSDGGMYDKQGKVSSISGVINRSTGSVQFRADFPNPDRLLHSGATGNIMMKNQYKDVIIIPQSSTVTLQDKLLVYRVINGKAVSTAITVAPYNDGRTYIVHDGLKAGDEIVADGAGMVQEGMEIK